MSFSFEKLEKYHKDIVGKWQKNKGEAIFEFYPAFRLTTESKLTIYFPDEWPSNRDYVIWYKIEHGWLLSIKFGLTEQHYKIKYLSDSMLILRPRDADEIEEVFTKIP